MNEHFPELEQQERRSWEQGTWTHLPYVILRDLTEQRLEEVDQEIVQAHLELCFACRKEADDLRALRQSLQETPVSVVRRPPALWLPAFGALAGAGALALVLLPTLKNAERLALTQSEQQAQLARLEQALASTSKPQSTPTPSTPQPNATPAPELALLRQKVAALEKEMRESSSRQASPTQVALALPDLRVLEGTNPRSLEAGAATYTLISPVGVVTAETRPKLSWEPCPSATHYKVLVARVGELQPVAQAETLAPKTVWQPERALPRGTALTWEVHAYDSAGQELAEAPLARFQCITEAQEKRIQKALTALARARAQAEAGLFAEAQATLMLLPDSPPKQALLTALARATEER